MISLRFVMPSLRRVSAIALNTYREAIRARLLLSLLGLSSCLSIYSIFLAALTLHQESRAVADIGAFSVSAFSIAIAISLGATSLYRELELKTIFPILSRPLSRAEYVVGKFAGTALTLLAFNLLQSSIVVHLLAYELGTSPLYVLGSFAFSGILGAILFFRAKHHWVYLALFVFLLSLVQGLLLYRVTSTYSADLSLFLHLSVLAFFESSIVAAIATLFSSFSSPFLTAGFSAGLFFVGRSADTLAHLPVKQFGESIGAFGRGLARVVPNLQLFVPPRPILLGALPGQSPMLYTLRCCGYASLIVLVVVTLAAVLFRKRDFQ